MRTKWFFLGCLTSVILLLAIITFSFVGLMKISTKYASQQVADVKPGTVLHLKLSGPILEYNEFYDNYFMETALGAHQITQKIAAAARDEKVKAIFLEPAWISCGYAVLHELKLALLEFKAEGKPVYAYLERSGNKDYLLASVADEIFLNPSASGGILLTGVGSSMLFYKDLFDKIGVDVTVIHAGEYKGFGESFSRKNLSPPVRQNLETLLNEIYENVLKDMALNREIAYSEAEYIYEARPELFISGHKALAYDLVDELIFFEDAVNRICDSEKQLISFKKYRPAPELDLSSEKVAVVYLQGEIMEGNLNYGTEFINFQKLDDILDKLETDNSVKSVVLRIDSPGGSALESEIIFDRIEKFKNIKPLIVSMSNVAASGGYYISAAGDYIYADPYSVTGSIGVATIIPNFKKMADKIGITTDTIKKGKYVDIFNPFTTPDDHTINALKASSEGIYDEFLKRVSSSRGIPLEQLKQIAGGRVWSSKKALNSGLIDAVGSLYDAIGKAAELAQLTDYSTSYFPVRKSLIEEFLKRRFDLDLTSLMINQKLDKELEINKLRSRYLALKQDPVQAIIPFELN